MPLDPAVIVAPIAALFGVALGPLISSGTERRAWLRRQKYEIAAGVVSAARIVLWRGDEIDPSRLDPPLANQRERVRQAMFTLREQLSLVDLLFDVKVVRAAKNLENHFGETVVPYFMNLASVPDVASEEVARARTLMTHFQDSARASLQQRDLFRPGRRWF